MPALTKVKQQAKIVVCQSRLHSICFSFMTYAGDYQYFPSGFRWPYCLATSFYKLDPVTANALIGYGLKDVDNKSTAWKCSEYKGVSGYVSDVGNTMVPCEKDRADYFHLGNYVIQTRLKEVIGYPGSPSRIKYQGKRSPSKPEDKRGPLVCDRLIGVGSQFMSNHSKHGGYYSPVGYNQLYSDGSVKWFRTEEAIEGWTDSSINDNLFREKAMCGPNPAASYPWFFWVEE